MFSSIRFSSRNVALLYVAASAIVLSLFAGPLWYVWNNTIEKGRIELLEADAQKMASLFDKKGPGQLAAVIDARVGDRLDRTRQILLLADPSMVKIAGNLPSVPSEIFRTGGTHPASIRVDGRTVKTVLFHQKLPGGYHLVVGRDVARFEILEQLFLYGLLGSGAMVCLVAVVGGLLIRRAIISRVQNINRTTSAIVAGDLSRRLRTLDSEDELEVLAQTVNRMLDQIEHLIHSVRNASNAIAHDLRTPLAELRSRLEELSVTRPASEGVFTEIDAALVDVDRIIAIFNALLRLAEIDSGTRRSGFVRLDITKVASDVTEFYQPVAELKGIALIFKCAGELPVPCDPLLLAQAIGNLIDNALKYAQRKGAITVQAKRRSIQAVEVTVCDDGPGIADAEKNRVTERFYRSDASRGTPGVGLGLSLVDAVARLHGGMLELGDNHPGLRATLVLQSHDTEIFAEPVPPLAKTAAPRSSVHS
jgi:signal transduction histidine kinase